MPLMLHLIHSLFGFKAIERMVEDPWTPPPSLFNTLMRPKPVATPKDEGRETP